MSNLSIKLHWQRISQSLTPGRYNTKHTITYHDNCVISSDAAPDWGGDAKAVNPEQTLAASLSSCHMMTFLALAAKVKWPVAIYHDDAEAFLGKNKQGHMAVTELKLHPRVSFDYGFNISQQKLEKMHYRAHRYCFIAHSISAKMTIQPILA